MIADFDVTEQMLRHFIQKVHQNRWAHPRVVVCVPSGVTGVEKRAVEEACLSRRRPPGLPDRGADGRRDRRRPAGRRADRLDDRRHRRRHQRGRRDLARRHRRLSQSIRVGGDELDEAIVNYVKREYKLMIGQQTAEEVKLEIGSAHPMPEEVQAEIRGRDLVSGLPKTIVLTSEEVRAALDEPVSQIIDAVKETLDRTPPELASDIMDRGIMLAGGGSLLQGLSTSACARRPRCPRTSPNHRSPAWRSAPAARSRSSRRSTARARRAAAAGDLTWRFSTVAEQKADPP